MNPRLRHALALATRRDTVITASRLALVVGPVLILINQWDALFGPVAFSNWKAILTFAVPYGVSTWTAVSGQINRSTPAPRQG